MKKVITYGTFDLFHKGHYNILKRAKEAGDYLIVGVTGESYDAERGKLSVRDSLATRIENVRKTGFADQIIVEEYLGQKIQDIIKYGVDILVIGSDWKGKFDHLSKYCEVRYLERTKDISSTQLREEMRTYSFGIVTDDLCDNDNVTEPKHVSGIHVKSIYSGTREIAERFCEKYELDRGYTDYDEFLESVDIVYIKSERSSRVAYIEGAIKKHRHVICDAPYTLDPDEMCRLHKAAEEAGVILINNITTVYLQAFGQLLWMARGNLIGDLVSVECSISRDYFEPDQQPDFYELSYYALCAIAKIMGTGYDSCNHKLVESDNGTMYGMINLVYGNSIAGAEICLDVESDCGMTITGSEGTIIVPEDWWRIGYFKLRRKGEREFKRYCSNFEGNGFRYLIQSVLSVIRSGRSAVQRISIQEEKTILDILKDIRQ